MCALLDIDCFMAEDLLLHTAVSPVRQIGAKGLVPLAAAPPSDHRHWRGIIFNDHQ